MSRTSENQAQPARLLPLVLFGAGAALIYLAGLLRFPLLTYYSFPITNLTKLTEARPFTGAVLAACILLLFGAYSMGAGALGAAAQEGGRRARLYLPVIGFPLVFVAILLLVYPVTSIDLYDYVFRGRMLAHYQINTFVRTPSDFSGDPLFWFVAWRRSVTAYGPLWEGMSWLTARLSGQGPGAAGDPIDGLLRMLIGYKLLAALGYLLCGAAIWGALGLLAPRQRLLGLYLWLWNPLVLWETIGAGHNDAWMALLIVAAVWAYTAGYGGARPSPRLLSSSASASFVALALGGLIKYLAVIFGPLLLAASLRRLPDWRARLRLLVIGGLMCGTLIVLAYAPFWEGWATLRNFGDRRSLLTASWLAGLQVVLAGFMRVALSQAIATALGLSLLTLGVLWSAWRAWQHPERVASYALWLLLWFLFFCNPWFQPWYLLWAVALVALQPWRARVVWSVGLFCCTALLSYLAHVFLLPLVPWDGESLPWQTALIALIYLPPLLVLGWDGLARRRSLQRLSLRRRKPVAEKPALEAKH